ncbi:methyl-accepting chemotaxis protein [Desulfoluna butyratoxydans]|uniref:Methyl-accepting chemotaxis protein (Mcp) signalling domain n=1 Tax=Desulfoluna butyratoxydans TaxID=231438 RepID=A0A4U8YRJ2_9BACT|nr:methyl-accepting chemotaxis protein [Desulfoluna butyratoxydans]VFQ43893.1 methyl-accepting chemotaxis protein (mcp) signalling domain [Desulfoluna butyratoxydans]
MWQSLSTGKKIWCSLLILMAGYAITTGVGLIGGYSMRGELNQVSDTMFPAAMESLTTLAKFKAQVKLYGDAVMAGDTELLEAAGQRADEVISHLDAIAGLDPGAAPEARALAQQIRSFSDKALTIYTRVAEDFEGTDTEAARESQALANETKVLTESLATLSKTRSEALQSRLHDVGQEAGHQQMMNLALFIVVVVATILFNLIIIRRFITGPLSDTVEMVKDIAQGEGDLTKRLTVHSKDDVGQLAFWMNKFIENLQSMIARIADNATSLNDSAEELTRLSGNLKEGAHGVKSKSEAVSTASDQMKGNMDSVAAAMEQASTSTTAVAASTEEMTATIRTIAESSERAREITMEAVTQSRNATERVGELGNQAEAIGKVTEAITDISEQTNLLALNATIEAARAGEYGKGFAVVAAEIKDLARQTADATRDIRDTIVNIQTSTQATIGDIEGISGVIDKTSDIVSEIASSVDSQAQTTQGIADNVTQISSGLSEINENVAATSGLSSTIAQDIEDVSHASGDMNESCARSDEGVSSILSMSENLTSMVGRFKV